MIGVLRDLSGSYTVPLYVCMALEVAAAIGVLIGLKSRPVRA